MGYASNALDGGRVYYEGRRRRRRPCCDPRRAAARDQRRIELFIEALERFWNITVPTPRRERLLTNDPLALEAACGLFKVMEPLIKRMPSPNARWAGNLKLVLEGGQPK